MKNITITFPDNSTITVQDEIRPITLLSHFSDGAKKAIAVLVNNELCSLHSIINVSAKVEPVYADSKEGAAIYRRSLCFLLATAAHRLFPGRRLLVGHSLGHGYYYTIDGDLLTATQIENLQSEMQKLVEEDLPIDATHISYMEACELFEKLGLVETRKQLNYRSPSKIKINVLEEFADLYVEPLVSSTGILKTFNLLPYHEGFLLRFPSHHTPEELAPFEDVLEQKDFRRQLVIDELQRADIPINFDAVIGRGGLVKPLEGGVYEINTLMVRDTLSGIAMHNHACNLGCLIANEIAEKIDDCRSFIADPGVVDELNDYARISGSPLMKRICIWHALNQRAIARRYAAGIGKEYEDLNLIICHMGGGISIAAHQKGRAVDANNALDGEGPFSPERAGSLPASDLIRLCFSGKYTEKQLLKRIAGQAGLNAHLGTNDVKEIIRRIEDEGDEHAKLILDAMIYHVAKHIAAEAAVLCGEIDAILLTGGLARSEYIVSRLRRRIGFLGHVYCFPGEDEMGALALNALDVLRGKRLAKVYT